MRVSTNQIQDVAINSILDQQSKLSNTQRQISTGERITRPSDDPVGAARIIDLRESLDTTKQYQDNIQEARARLTIEEGVLDGIGDTLQRVRELAIQANNGSQTAETRDFISREIEQLLEQLLGMANARDNNNEFLFAGSITAIKPFSRRPDGSYAYQGDDGQRMLQVGPERQIPVGDSGTDVFRAIRNGNGIFTIQDSPGNRGSGIIDPGTEAGTFIPGVYTITFAHDPLDDSITYQVTDATGAVLIPAGTPYASGDAIIFNGVQTAIEGEPADGDSFIIAPAVNQDIFTTIQDYIVALRGLEGDAPGNIKMANATNRLLPALDLAMGRVLEVRANAGARLNALDAQSEINASAILKFEEILSDIQDLDYAEAVSRLNLELTGLDAAQKAFVRVQNLSLFNHL